MADKIKNLYNAMNLKNMKFDSNALTDIHVSK